MIMFRLKESMFWMLDETVSVNVQVVICPGLIVSPSRFHVKLIYVDAPAGFQLFVVMLKVKSVFPSFLRYTV